MNRKTLTALTAGMLGVIATVAAPFALAGDQKFSLSSEFDNSSGKYETGPWMFKLTAPVGGSGNADIPRIRTNGTAGSRGVESSRTKASQRAESSSPPCRPTQAATRSRPRL